MVDEKPKRKFSKEELIELEQFRLELCELGSYRIVFERLVEILYKEDKPNGYTDLALSLLEFYDYAFNPTIKDLMMVSKKIMIISAYSEVNQKSS
jgi:hypothetical protein